MKTKEDSYDYVKTRKPEAYRRAVEIGSFVSSYINFADPVDHLEVSAKVELCIMELLAQTLRDFDPEVRAEMREARLKSLGFEEPTQDQIDENRFVNLGHVR